MKVLCVHPNSELYGSDKSFLQILNYFKNRSDVESIVVVLPQEGLLTSRIRDLGLEIRIMNLAVLRKRDILSLKFGYFFRAFLTTKKKLNFLNEFDLVYVNTIIIFDFYLLLRLYKGKKYIHVREVAEGPALKVFELLLKFSKSFIIYNSNNTRLTFNLPDRNSAVVLNAFEGYGNYSTAATMNENAPLKAIIIGRINSWKGQDFVINALGKLDDNANFELKIIGDVYSGNEHLVTKLNELVALNGLLGKVSFEKFSTTPEDHYKWADLVIVPSIKKEPFGRVAIEAMSLSKAVLASDNGGLVEIVDHGVTGFLFKTADEVDFNNYFSLYQNNRNLLLEHGKKGHERFINKFYIDALYANLNKII